MSKKKDTRQLLVESSEFATKISISQTLKESLEMSKGKAGTLIVRNIPATLLNRPNQNNRIYSTKVMQEAINEAKRNHAFELKLLNSKSNEHPEGSYIAPTDGSHVVINAYIKPNVKILVDGKEEVNDVLFMDWEVLNTHNGKDLRALLEAECSVGVSIRGLGDLNGQNVENYELLGCDCVGNPSSSTYTRMIMSESVQVELKDPRQLQETYTVTTSSTNVVRDLDTASQLQAELDRIGYGTVVKTSTKLDSETDPKTGAETTITTLEAETEDDVGDLDQALMMAKNAMLNGTVNIDSITIENVKEEQPKESTKDNESGDITLKEKDEVNPILDEYKANHVGSPEKVAENMVQRQYNFIISNLPESDILRQQAENIFAKFEHGEINAIDTKIALGDVAYEVQKKLWGESCSKKEVEEYIPESEIPETNMSVNESILVEADKLYEEIYNIIKEQNVPVDKACRIYCEKHDNIPYEYVLEYMKDVPGMEESIKEATEEKKDPKEGKKFVLKTPSGFVAMDGNALVFKDDPKQALHFISGKEESGLVHLSGVQKILDTMGVYDVEKYYRKPTTDISVSGEIANNEDVINISNTTEEPKKEATLQEEDTTGGKFTAIVNVEELGGEVKSEEIPVASTELSSMQNEIGNLYQQKSKNGQVYIKIRDNESEKMYMYNPEMNTFDELQESSDGTIKQDDNKLSIEIDDDHTVEKEFDTKAQASVAKAGVEQGKLDGDVLLNEDEDEWDYHYSGTEQAKWENPDNPSLSYDLENSAICAWCGDRLPKHEMKHERKLGWLCNHCIKGLQSREGKLEFEEDSKQYDSIEAGWYVSCPNHMEIGISGPYESKEEASKGLEEYEDILSFDYISPEDIQQFEENSKMDEVLYKRASNPSDPYINEPLNEEETNPDLFKTVYYYKDPKSYIMFTPQDDNTVKVTTSFKVDTADGEDYETGDDILVKDEAARYWKKLYTSGLYVIDEPNKLGEAEEEPSEDDVNNDPEEDIQITLGNIDWDIDSITDNFMSNAQSDDVATEKDLNSLINDLPDTLTLTAKAKDLNMDEPKEVRNSLMDLANKTSGLKINNATILDIK